VASTERHLGVAALRGLTRGKAAVDDGRGVRGIGGLEGGGGETARLHFGRGDGQPVDDAGRVQLVLGRGAQADLVGVCCLLGEGQVAQGGVEAYVGLLLEVGELVAF